MTKQGLSSEAWLALLAALGSFIFVARECLWLWPGYAGGDEMTHAAKVWASLNGAHVEWHTMRGMLQVGALAACLKLFGKGLAQFHALGLGAYAVELVCLYLLARRWFGARAAAWAVLILTLQAGTWLRTRSILTFQWVPAIFLVAMLLATKVRSRPMALLWGAALGLLTSDYDAAALAVPFLLALCSVQEPGFKAQWRWALVAWALALASTFLFQADHGAIYFKARYTVSLKADAGQQLWQVALGNAWQALSGGKPRPYLAVQDWPIWAPWAWIGLALGALECLRRRAWPLLAWALLYPLAVLCTQSPHGLPSHRIYMAVPALALISGLGMARFMENLKRPQLLWLVLALALFTESLAWTHHMAVARQATWGRSRDLASSAQWLQQQQRPGDRVLTRWAALHTPDLGLHFGPPGQGSTERGWFLAPLQLRAALNKIPGLEQQLFKSAPDSEPTLLVLAEGKFLQRLLAIEGILASLATQAERRAWLLANPKADLWARAAVLESYRGPLPEGPEPPQEYYAWGKEVLPVSPGPLNWLAKTYLHGSERYALEICTEVLELHPDYSPALHLRLQALERLGRKEEAAQARQAWTDAYRQGAWQIYDRP